MNTQPEALLLAEDLIKTWCLPVHAAKLRRLHLAREECERQYQAKCDEIGALHEVNQELLEALREAADAFEIASNGGGVNFYEYAKGFRETIAKATGEDHGNS